MDKRFTFDNKSLLKDNEFWLDGQVATLCNAEEICQELNELHEENKQLKTKLQTYKTSNSLLKATMDRHRTENQQIRDTIKEIYETERTELGRSVLKQLLNNIGEI